MTQNDNIRKLWGHEIHEEELEEIPMEEVASSARRHLFEEAMKELGWQKMSPDLAGRVKWLHDPYHGAVDPVPAARVVTDEEALNYFIESGGLTPPPF